MKEILNNNSTPGISGNTFKIKFNDDWINQRQIIITPEYKVSTTHGIFYLSKEEILDKFEGFLTEDQIKLLSE